MDCERADLLPQRLHPIGVKSRQLMPAGL